MAHQLRKLHRILRCKSFKSYTVEYLLEMQRSLLCQYTQIYGLSIQHNHSLLLQHSYMFQSTNRTIIGLGGKRKQNVLERSNMQAKYKLNLFWGHLKNDQKKKPYVSVLCQLIVIIYVKTFLK